ncbi:UDP-N-acetylglucosamine--N-acetylmuramyl-(pentapeptide) pyrophosphoryl-undecaprenol N-acetylglucosamine transferase [Candidatus Fermentibacteria bacterium]|nr:UDP-N-acetylglucosamine--N-acetylmuramyl-(pentapeptide) pyrophosphoryl-undecaprenol N-acetylglucosamine transferase [Candidatus Fermentibacteria bacterium]
MSRILIAGGGTGGHIAPAIAVAEALLAVEPSVSVSFVRTPRPVDGIMYAPFGGSARILDSPRVDRGPLSAPLLPFTASRALAKALGIIRDVRPDAIFVTGGYASFFCAAAGWLRRIPVLLHESNALPGRANRAASRFARRVLVGFECAAAWFGRKAVVAGNPVRTSLARIARAEARTSLGLAPHSPVVLVLGGSQGARALNDIALAAPEGIQVALQCGERDFERVAAASSGRRGFHVTAFEPDPSVLYSAADFAVARAGAMTMTELSHYAIPCVLVPYPLAAGDHQTPNAMAAAATGGALAVQERDADAGSLWNRIASILSDAELLSSMSAAISRLFRPGSAEAVARMILTEAGWGASS